MESNDEFNEYMKRRDNDDRTASNNAGNCHFSVPNLQSITPSLSKFMTNLAGLLQHYSEISSANFV